MQLHSVVAQAPPWCIDANGNDTLDAANDMMVVLTGTAAVALSDFGF